MAEKKPALDMGTFHVQTVMIHQIPTSKKNAKEDNPPVLTDAPCELDDRRRAYFQSRIRRSLQNAFAVVRDPDESSPVPGLIHEFFNGKDDRFVGISQEMARHLHTSQGGSSPGGLLAVIEGTILAGSDVGKCMCLMKLEMESGVHVELGTTAEGLTTFKVEIEEVTLTQATRVFKAGVFPRFSEASELVGLVSDAQLDSATVGREIAEYFLSGFLGCSLRPTATVATKRYYEAATEYFNSLEDDEKKLRYDTAFTVDLQSQSPTLNPQKFAREQLDVEDRDNFLARFKEGDGRVGTFLKDTDLISTRVRRAWVELTNGVRVTGPPEEVEQAVTAIRTARDDRGMLIVTSGIKQVK